MRPSLAALALLLAASTARADGLDRDTLLTDAPATPKKGTVRVSAGGDTSPKAADGATGTTGQVSASVSWTPIKNLSADVGAYFQNGDRNGPSARVRYQILSQERAGVDLAAGVRFKTEGFHPDKGELEFILAAGKSYGNFDLVLNGVFGVATGGEEGKDIEVKAFAGYRFSDAVRAGLDSRLQMEVEDEAAVPAAPKVGRDFDLRAGPAVSWLIANTVQLQALAGVAAPKASDKVVPVAVLMASFDF